MGRICTAAVSAPIMTANWEAESDHTWMILGGGGFGKIFRVGEQAINESPEAYYNVQRAEFSPDWALRPAIQLMLPK